MKEYILQQFNSAGFEIEESAAEKFLQYYNLISKWNEKFNLTAITNFEDFVLKHFIDCAYGLKFLKGAKNLCDVGAGAGFPSVPLKILYPQIALTMIDSVNKKITFLKEAAAKLNLSDCDCLHTRAEDAAKGNLRESFDAVCARAVAPLSSLCEYCLPFVKKGGIFIAYKGDADEEIKQAKSAIKILGGEISVYEKYQLALSGHARSLIVIKKIKPTDKKYPRGKNKERTNPL